MLGPTLPASVRLSPKATTPEKFGWAKPGATVNGKPRTSRKAAKSLLDRDVINYPVWVWVDFGPHVRPSKLEAGRLPLELFAESW